MLPCVRYVTHALSLSMCSVCIGAAVPAIAFPRALEDEWMLVSFLGMFMDVVVYHTFSLFLKSCTKLLVRIAPRAAPVPVCMTVWSPVPFRASAFADSAER